MSLATFLVLADGRLPAGSHAHSGGLEAAVVTGGVHDVPSLAGYLRGRLATTGVVTASFAASACARTPSVLDLDAGLDARTPSPALRRASRAQGRALLRAAAVMWPINTRDLHHPVGHRLAEVRDLHHPVALGVVAAAAGLGPLEAATAAVHGTLTGPATAAVRLLGLDPFAVHALLAALAPTCDLVAADAVRRVGDAVDDLPADGAPLLDVGAEFHATREVRLFAS